MSSMVTGVTYLQDDQIRLDIWPCPVCKESHQLTVNQYAFENWVDGVSTISEAFPEKTLAERELLLTGIDGKCFSQMPSEEDEV